MRTTAPSRSLDHATSVGGAAARRALASFGLTAVLLSGAPAALGQGAVPCTAIENDSERLACYDRALRGTPAAPPAAPAPRATPAPAASAPPAAAAATRSPAAPTPAAPAEESRRERRIRESAAAAAAPPPAAPAAPAAPSAGAAQADAAVPIVVVGVRTLPGRETSFTADNGVVWLQTDSQRLVNMPDTPFDAEIKPGAMGSYFLVPKERGRAIRVRRVDTR